MALTATQTNICNKLVSDYYTLIAPVKAIKRKFRDTMNQLDAALRLISLNPGAEIDAALDSLEDSIEAMLPGDDIEAIDDLLTMIDQCEYLNNILPVTTMGNSVIGLFDKIDIFTDDLAAAVPELGAGKIASALNKLLNGVGLPGGDKLADILKEADKLLNCLAIFCAVQNPGDYSGNVTDITDDLQTLYDDMNIIDNPADPDYGKFDYDTFYDEVGLNNDQKSAMNTVIIALDLNKDNSMTAVENSVNAIKEYMKTGEVF